MNTPTKPFSVYQPKPDTVEEAIQSLAQLPVGWDYGSGYPASKEVVRKALEVYSLATLAGVSVEPTPQTNGGIRLTLMLSVKHEKPENQEFLDITINPDLTLDMCHERGFGANFDTITEKENVDKAFIVQKINNILNNREWNLSEPFTLENSVRQKGGSKVTVSSPSVWGFPSFPQLAPFRNLVACAPM